MNSETTRLAAPVERLVSQRWRVQAWSKESNEWYFIGSDATSLDKAIWYRDHCITPNNRRSKLRIIEESVTEKVVG